MVAVLTLPAAAQAPTKTAQWKMQSSWPAADFHQVNPKGLVDKIAEMTGHPPYEFAADYYWKGVNPYKILKP